MDIFTLIQQRFPLLDIERRFSFARHTTIGCGGYAEVAAYPKYFAEAVRLISFLKDFGIPYCILGAGANVLPQDEDFDGVVVRFCSLSRIERTGQDTVYAETGVTGGALLRACRAFEIGGFEPFTGIPMTVGGGTAMNAGIAVRHFSDVVSYVDAEIEGDLVRLSEKECAFSLKDSLFLHGAVVLGVGLKGAVSESGHILREAAIYRARRAHLPKGRSMGCVFVNPEGYSAGKIIDECGLKGAREGGATVSDVHANFIINRGGTAADVARLIERIKNTVFEKRGIALREEIRRIP
ncbi:MAG: UDP-N-acetylmuramate dehydrogenase [Clostridiales bacterium]|nr:UDP-N-acetylmuramate dehydrogenase [Clostridiales bacterium]